jgi:hypothetical protein
VVVDVDEAGREDQVFGVNGPLAWFGFEISDFDDAVACDANIGFAQRLAGTVCDLGVQDYGGSGSFLGARKGLREDKQRR